MVHCLTAGLAMSTTDARDLAESYGFQYKCYILTFNANYLALMNYYLINRQIMATCHTVDQQATIERLQKVMYGHATLKVCVYNQKIDIGLYTLWTCQPELMVPTAVIG